jgi:GH25 family lysozyme M1 (1,4-beta-N-acetylmuramidase)
LALNGIDVSAYQPADITKLVAYDFVYIKATQGTDYVSGSCDAQYQAAKAAGHLLGVYHFADGGDANAEAEFFVKNVGGYIGEAILVLDMEANALAKGATWAYTFLARVKALTGVTPIIYGSRGNICIPSYASIAGTFPLWVAMYPDGRPGGYVPGSTPGTVSPWKGAVCYQYEDLGQLPGYSANLDLDVFYGTAADWHALAAKGGATTPPPAIVSAPTPVHATAPIGKNITSRPTEEIQKLVGVKPDNIYGADTTAAVMKWQKAHGLTDDGIWGPASDAKGFPPAARPELKAGAKSAEVGDLQRFLNANYPAYSKLAVDNDFGPATEAVVKEFQDRSGLNPDGIVGPATWAKLDAAGFKG